VELEPWFPLPQTAFAMKYLFFWHRQPEDMKKASVEPIMLYDCEYSKAVGFGDALLQACQKFEEQVRDTGCPMHICTRPVYRQVPMQERSESVGSTASA
jgi:hypothetical protein